VAELAARARRLAVVVEVRAGHREDRVPVGHLADAVHHRARSACSGRPEGTTEDGAEMVLELAGLGAFDGPMARVVHPRRDLVREQLAVDLEQFDREHADVIEVGHQPDREVLTAPLERGIQPRRGRA